MTPVPRAGPHRFADLETCKINGVDPNVWLVKTLRAINGVQKPNVSTICPWNAKNV